MRALVQRVSKASVSVDSKVVGKISSGLVVLLGVSRNDEREDLNYIVAKVVNLRIISDELGKFTFSALDTKAELLVISQFTLYGNPNKGRRPSFTEAAGPDNAKTLFNETISLFQKTGLKIETGQFQAHMAISMIADGPVTIMLDSADRSRA